MQLAINGYAINLDTWNAMSAEEQTALEGGINELVNDIWTYSEELYADAMNCNTGKEPCVLGTAYSLAEVPVSDADLATVAAAVAEKSLPVWAEQCNAVYPECEARWLETVGAKLGL